MKPLQRYRAMEAFCRQRSKMEGEDELFWLTEAEVLAKLATNAHRMQVLKTYLVARKGSDYAAGRGRTIAPASGKSSGDHCDDAIPGPR